MKKDKVILVVLASIVLLFVVAYVKDNKSAEVEGGFTDIFQEERTLSIGEVRISLELADTTKKRQRGLSGRESLAKNAGMLLILDSFGRGGIWMKDMMFPIDIIWINKEKQIISIKENAQPESYPEVFYPDTKATFVLEVNAGVVSENNIVTGDFIEL